MMKWKAIFLVFVLIDSVCAVESILTEGWKFDVREEPNHVFVLNVDENPSLEIIADAKLSGRIFAVDRAGSEVWHYNVAGIIFDLYAKDFEDDKGEIIAGSFSRVYSIDRSGESNWKYFTLQDDVVSVFLDDLDADKRGEAVFGTTSWRGNTVFVLDEDGSPILKYGVQKSLYPYIFEAADVNNDSKSEIAVGFCGFSMNTKTKAYELGFLRPSALKVLSLSGDELWSFETLGGVRSLKVADFTGHGSKEFVVGSNRMVYVVDGKGKLLWVYPTGDLVYDLDVYDLDGDGRNEVVVGSDSVYVIKDDGKLLWKSNVLKGVYAIKAADLDSDGSAEIVAGTSRIVVYDKTGKLLWSSGDFKEATDIKISDLDLDGYVEVISSSTDGRVRVFETEPYAKKKKAEKLLAEARVSYNKGDYNKSQETALVAKKLFQELSNATKMGEAGDLAAKARDHADADRYYNESLMAYDAKRYDLALKLASNASEIYARLKDVQAMNYALLVYEASQTRPNSDSNYSMALELKSKGDFVNAGDYARRALSGYTQLNETELMSETEGLVSALNKYAEGKEYYTKAEEFYVRKEFSNASIYLEHAKAVYGEVGYEDGLNDVKTLEDKISQTYTLKNVFVVGGVGIVIVLGVGLVLAVLILYLMSKKKKNSPKKKEGLEDSSNQNQSLLSEK